MKASPVAIEKKGYGKSEVREDLTIDILKSLKTTLQTLTDHGSPPKAGRQHKVARKTWWK